MTNAEINGAVARKLGWKERKERAGRNSGEADRRAARKLMWNKNIYQILCFNCNLAKGVNGGICPHQQISTVNV